MLYLIDLYEGIDLIAADCNEKEIRKEYNKFIEETDGECNLIILDDLKLEDKKNLWDMGLI